MDDRRRVSPMEAEAEGRRALLRIIRVGLVALMIGVTTLWGLQVGQEPWWLAIPFALGLSVAVIAIDVLTPRKKISTLSGVFLGLLAGLMVTIALSRLIDLLAQSFELQGKPIMTTVKVVVGIAVCYLTVSIVLQTQDDFRLVIPYVEFAKQFRGVRPMLLDTSALIDGRVLELAQSGFLRAPIVIPRFVVEELQRLADSSDRMKRARGRRGLDMVAALQRSAADVTIDDASASGVGVDQMLVDMAQREGMVIVTTDSGLTRVAGIHNAEALNLHQLSAALRPSVVPGEVMSLRVVKPGEQAGQGVGYLDDGAMVVIENGGGLIGQEVSVTVTGTLQTSAGRLIFARAPGDEAGAAGEAREAGVSDASAPGRADAAALPGESSDPGAQPGGLGGPDAAGGETRPGPFPPVRASARRAQARNPRRG